MKTLLKTGFILACALTVGQVFAQNESKPKEKKDPSDDIIIHKKGSTNEKLTIVIDGDKVTVNGKAVDDFKNENVEIIHGDYMMAPDLAFEGPMVERRMNILGDDFMREIHSNKAFLGVMTERTDEGAKITDVTKESSAEKAGLKEGDIITKINDTKIEDADDLYKVIGKYKPNDKINVTYKRAGKETTASVTLAENKQVRAFAWKNGDGNDFNFNFKTAPPGVPRNGYMYSWSDKPRLGIHVQDTEDGKGVKVLDVDDEEAADKAGLQEDDVITQVNGKSINSVDDIKAIMKDVKKGDTVKITYLRDGKSLTADVKFPKDLKSTDL